MSLTHDALTNTDGRSLALLLWGKTEDGKDDVAIFIGTLRNEGGGLCMIQADGSPVTIRPEWYDRIKPVSDSEIASVLRGAEFVLSLSIGDLPETLNPAELESLGVKWPT